MRRNALEWAVLALSVAAIVVLVGVLVVSGLSESRPADPRVELRLSEARQGTLGWIIPGTITNGGDEPAQGVVIEAAAQVGGQTETSGVEIDHLPAGTAVEVTFAFSAQPAGEVTARLVGYRVP